VDECKPLPLGRVMDTAKQIMRDALPIKCVEAVFLALHLTGAWHEAGGYDNTV